MLIFLMADFGCAKKKWWRATLVICDSDIVYAEKKTSEFGLSRPVSGQKTPNC
jgi:hypothetical protein